MKKYVSHKWAVVLLLFSTSCIAYLYENKNNTSHAGASLSGGNLVCYDQCLSGSQSIDLSFPLISSFDINSVEINSIDSNISDCINITLSFNPNERSIYKNYNIYHFSLSISQKKELLVGYNEQINSISLNINNAKYNYTTPNFRLFNDIYLSQNGSYAVNSGDLLLSYSDMEHFTLPASPDTVKNTFYNNSVNSSCIISSMVISSFLNFDNFMINGSNINTTNINYTISSDSTLDTIYSLSYTDETCSRCIVKSALIVYYIEENTNKIFVSNIPFHIYPGQNTSYVCEQYIDSFNRTTLLNQ